MPDVNTLKEAIDALEKAASHVEESGLSRAGARARRYRKQADELRRRISEQQGP